MRNQEVNAGRHAFAFALCFAVDVLMIVTLTVTLQTSPAPWTDYAANGGTPPNGWVVWLTLALIVVLTFVSAAFLRAALNSIPRQVVQEILREAERQRRENS